LCVEVEVEI